MEVRDNHIGGQNEVASGEREPIENVLKRVSLRHFNSLCKENILLNRSSNGTHASGSQITQNGYLKSVNPFIHQDQTAVNGLSSTSTNPFTQGKDSNGNTVFRDNNKDLILRDGHINGWSSTSSTPSLENDWAIFPPTNLSQETNQITFPNKKWDIFQDSHSAKISPTGLSNQKANIFEPFKEETSVFQRMVANEKTSNERVYLLEYIQTNQKNDEQPIPSTTASNQLDIFEDLPSFLPSQVISDDIFPNTAASQSFERYHTPESSVKNRVFQNIQLFETLASVQNDNSHLSKNFSMNNGQFKPQNSHVDKMFMPTDLSQGIFQETSTLPSPLNASTNGGLLFRRLPPKPAPRSKAPKNHNQSINHDIISTPAVSVPADQKAAQTLFTSTLPTPISIPIVPRPTTNIQDTMLADEKNQSQVYEDVLFIGQEKCVEDWPVDSPELSPDWKPAGKFKLRRESLRISLESEAALNAISLGKKSGNTRMKLRISGRGSKDKSGDDPRVQQIDTVPQESKENYPDSLNGAYGDTMPWGTKFHASDDHFLPEQEDQNARMKSKSVKSKKTKFTVPHLQYRESKKKTLREVFEDGSQFVPASKSELIQESYEERSRNSEEPVMKDCRPKKPLKLKPSLSHQLPKDAIEDDMKKMDGLSFLEESKENLFVRAERENHRVSTDLLAEYQHEQFSPKSSESSGKIQELQDYRPKKPIKFSFLHFSRKGSKSTLENDIPQKGADLFKASDIRGLEINLSEDYSEMRKSPVQTVSPIIRRDSKVVNDAEKGADLFKSGDITDDDWMENHTMDSKTEKLKKACLPSSKSKAKDQVCFPEDIEPLGATSGDYYLSEAAKAEWMSSQMDVRRARASDEDKDLEGVKEEEEGEGDTDSLMEWWNTVELWDELPPDEEISVKEDETKSFTEIADKVHRGLRVFYKVFTEQAEVLYLYVLRLYAIGDDISNFHRHAKIANITGGTTTAVGGVAAIAGLALAPVTLGASLIVSAVGLGVATAGGITAASATISDNLHDMNDRKKIEVVVQDYETRLVELRRCLRFVAEGVRRLRFHPLLRRNNYYTGDWEVRRALQTISLVGEPVEQAENMVEMSTMALNSVCKGMDNYFSKDSKELKKGCKKEVTMQVNMLAKLLHEGLVKLNSIREQLMEATGQV
ncbi:uncharacterized protein si:cabz01007807.1 isoform X2 [Ictalurus furcatus]|uniref:uncharacterized protein si:cabz01007807.1 isoform X2 n=1 Tax=Ictalurus furcatus TaxID=66913 RepID=UPI002350C281|nr:uncharacterized protein si:cabz01007807.1 isoform X2 [Ictalurus furcatus]